MSPPETLGGFLSGLKDSGCALLVTGDTDPETRAAVSRRLFGVPRSELEADEPTRKRVLVRTDRALRPRRYLPSGVDTGPETCSILDAAGGDRSTAATSPPTESDSLDRNPSTGLEGVADAVERRVDEILGNTTNLGPAELRIGCSSLLSLSKRFERDEIAAFARSVATTARRNRGMCHIHYPMDDGARPVRELSTGANARLELSTVGSRIYVTWHTPYENVGGAEQPISWFEMKDD